ncbi:aminodeoxychorismate lyase [Parachitinimonas caeni]|uniref:aminodeoxychorismate lyase n=1 Tax=Parachitinimonas caeni TaxID=3031301 RepID=A0ABT7DUS8_9NEIS|nr:aminodeoxychorismate lyase [Parachitinimonas caeni]MDK2123817.1 aminodeoxychorismate lyase [Parachitinimonas caeni]
MPSWAVDGVPGGAVFPGDRGLAYGDGVFRTLRCTEGTLWFWERQFAKLQHDATRLGLICPPAACWLNDLQQFEISHAVVKLMLTRGVGARGYASSPDQACTRIVTINPLPPLREQPAVVRICDWRLSLQPLLAGVKHLNRLDSVMARREWDDVAIEDGLMLAGKQEVVEGVASNLFARFGNELRTPDLSLCGVAGLTRDFVLEHADSVGLVPKIRSIDLEDLPQADELMLCNSVVGIRPIAVCGPYRWNDFATAQALQAQWQRTGPLQGHRISCR